MKKICLMSGAVVNAGDFLIEKRTKELINHFLPDSEVTVLKRVGVDYSDRIEELNSFDAILFSGGPLYQPNLYLRQLPFVKSDILKKKEIKTPVFFLGGGLHNNYYRCKYSETDRLFFDYSQKGIPLGCRDVFTLKFLEHEGYNALLTGCPAWYNLPFVDKTDIKKPSSFSKILVSDPADALNIPLYFDLLKHLRQRYPEAEISIVNHRELKTDLAREIDAFRDKYGIGFYDIAGSADGFSVYDDCDMHVGFRVHAHIYNLSRRNLSVLFNEDIRGIGVNNTVGLDNITVEAPTYRKKKIFGNYYLIQYNSSDFNSIGVAGWMFDDYMDLCYKNDFQNYKKAFEFMSGNFKNMSTFFNSLRAVIE